MYVHTYIHIYIYIYCVNISLRCTITQPIIYTIELPNDTNDKRLIKQKLNQTLTIST